MPEWDCGWGNKGEIRKDTWGSCYYVDTKQKIYKGTITSILNITELQYIVLVLEIQP